MEFPNEPILSAAVFKAALTECKPSVLIRGQIKEHGKTGKCKDRYIGLVTSIFNIFRASCDIC